MLKYHLMIALIFFLQSCTQENADGIQNNFDTEQLNKYKADLKQQYKNLVVVEQEVMTMDFIKLYFSDSTLYEKYNYSIEYKCEIYKLDKDHHKYLFYGEVIHFKKSNDIDSVISYIKEHNTIDPFNLKLHRIYRVGVNTIICTNYLDFDISNYENFLMREFNKSLTIEVINE